MSQSERARKTPPSLNVLVDIPKEKFFNDAAFCRHMQGNCRLIRWPPNLGVGGYSCSVSLGFTAGQGSEE